VNVMFQVYGGATAPADGAEATARTRTLVVGSSDPVHGRLVLLSVPRAVSVPAVYTPFASTSRYQDQAGALAELVVVWKFHPSLAPLLRRLKA
jgi:hypothetical protein